MALPRVIQEQVEQADAFVAQMTGQTDQTETAPQTAIDPQPDPNTLAQPVSQENEPRPAPVPEETWERKYLTLKGMYDAEVPRLHSQMREMNQQVQSLIAEAATAKAQQPRPEPVTAKTLITEQDKEAFGSDLLDLIDRAAEQKVSEVRGHNDQLINEIKELKGKLGNVSDRQVVSDKDRFLTQLTQQVPDWETLNVDSGFLAWLAEVDPVYGIPRQYALTNAYEASDASRTATIFKQYKNMFAPQTQQKVPNLNSQVAPTRSRSTPAPSNSNEGKRIFTQHEVSEFYNEWIKGHLTEQEAATMEAEINAAYVEGRIR